MSSNSSSKPMSCNQSDFPALLRYQNRWFWRRSLCQSTASQREQLPGCSPSRARMKALERIWRPPARHPKSATNRFGSLAVVLAVDHSVREDCAGFVPEQQPERAKKNEKSKALNPLSLLV